MAEPRYSKTCPVPPATPIRASSARITSFALTPGASRPSTRDLVGLRPALEQALGREDHLDLARPDPERERAERAVRGRVRVAAHDRHARLRQPELRPDDVDDALVRVAEPVERDAELAAVVLELADLRGGHLVEDRQVARRRRNGVVGGRDGPLGVPDAEAAPAQAGERLRARDLVDEVKVDREHARARRGPRRRRGRPRSCRRACAAPRRVVIGPRGYHEVGPGGPTRPELRSNSARSSQYFWAGVPAPRWGERSGRSANRRPPPLAVANPVHLEPPHRPRPTPVPTPGRTRQRRAWVAALQAVRPAARVWLQTAFLAGIAAVLYVVLLKDLPRPAHAVIGWPLLAAAFALAELKVVEVHFRRETHAFSLSEFPAVIGFFSLVADRVPGGDAPRLRRGAHRPAPPAADQDRLQPRRTSCASRRSPC